MNNNHFFARKVSSLLQWCRIYRLYRRAFPRSERKPFSMILSMHRRGRSDVWVFQQDGRFAGFASTINDDRLILLDYLAITESMRGQGIGSSALQALKDSYTGKGIFVEIESAFEKTDDLAERLRRKHFYMKNDMLPSRVMAGVFGVKMEILCWNCSVDFRRYHAFYRDNYSAWAADHIIEQEYPQQNSPDA